MVLNVRNFDTLKEQENLISELYFLPNILHEKIFNMLLESMSDDHC
jgi:hypothetical protein